MTRTQRLFARTGALICFTLAAFLFIEAGIPERREFTAFSISEDGIVAPETGAIAPPITGTTLTGLPIALDDLRGDPVIVNFWATWCGPCRFEMPELQRLYTARQQDGLHIIAVNLDEAPAEVERWVGAFGLTYDVIIDDGTLARRYAFRDPPTTFVIAPDGQIIRTIFGPVSMDELRDIIDPLLAG